jgi:hypothetical protein
MRALFLVILMCFAKEALADSADVKQLLNTEELFRYHCTYDQVTDVGIYEDQPYRGPSELRQQVNSVLISNSAVVAVKQLLVKANAESKKETRMDPLSISCARLR